VPYHASIPLSPLAHSFSSTGEDRKNHVAVAILREQKETDRHAEQRERDSPGIHPLRLSKHATHSQKGVGRLMISERVAVVLMWSGKKRAQKREEN
jgi:hypothetical protein